MWARFLSVLIFLRYRNDNDRINDHRLQMAILMIQGIIYIMVKHDDGNDIKVMDNVDADNMAF